MLKPLIRGHPFLLLCGAKGAATMLWDLGFRGFGPTLSGEALDQTWHHFPCDQPDGGKYIEQVISEMRRLQGLDESAWEPAVEAAHFNQRHIICPDGLRARLQQLQRNVLRFVAHVQRTPASSKAGAATPGESWLPSSAGAAAASGTSVVVAPAAGTLASSAAPSGGRSNSGGGSSSGGNQSSGTPTAGRCEYQCGVSCLELHGNLYRECKGCPKTTACHYGAEGYFTWHARARQWRETHATFHAVADRGG